MFVLRERTEKGITEECAGKLFGLRGEYPRSATVKTWGDYNEWSEYHSDPCRKLNLCILHLVKSFFWINEVPG